MTQDERQPSSLDASYGGVNLSVKGSIVVLALLTIVDMGATLWYLGLQTIHFDDTLSSHSRRLELQEQAAALHNVVIADLKASLVMQHGDMKDEVGKNRSFLAEVQKVCLMTQEQRINPEQTLSPAMRELLRTGDFERR